MRVIFMRTKHTFRLPPDLASKLADYAAQKRVPRTLVVEAELVRRLDRITRRLETLERHVTVSNEALAVLVRFWLTSTPPLPDAARAEAQSKGRERCDGFIEALGRRLSKGRTLADEVSINSTRTS
jgi:hypothetical protein